jgi:prefoldin subunit 5
VQVYKVVTRIDCGNAVYLPEGQAAHGSETESLGSGKLVPIDSTGFVELSDEEAARLLKAGAITSLDLEIAALEKKRDEAIKTAQDAQAALDDRKAQLEKVMAQKRQAGVESTEQKAVAQSNAKQKELVPAGRAPAKSGRK